MHRATSARLVHLSMGVMPGRCKWTAAASSASSRLPPHAAVRAGFRHTASSAKPLHVLPLRRRRHNAAALTAARHRAAYASSNGASQRSNCVLKRVGIRSCNAASRQQRKHLRQALWLTMNVLSCFSRTYFAHSAAGSTPEPGVLADEQPQLIQDVDWSSDLANTITLIGNMGCELQRIALFTLRYGKLDAADMARHLHSITAVQQIVRK